MQEKTSNHFSSFNTKPSWRKVSLVREESRVCVSKQYAIQLLFLLLKMLCFSNVAIQCNLQLHHTCEWITVLDAVI